MRKYLALLFFFSCVLKTIKSQVNLQTGSAEYSLPIFSYSDGKSGLSSTVSLNYFAGNGIKVSDIASNVGLGWILNASGSIERIQRGEPDDQYTDVADGITASDLIIKREVWSICDNFYPRGYLYGQFLYNNPKSLAIQPRFKDSQTKDFKQSREGSEDREQDLFACNLNGRVVNFLIGKDHSVECLDDSKLKITFTINNTALNNARTRINGFTVIDENGIQYKFNVLELSQLSISDQIYNDNSSNFNYAEFTDQPIQDYIVDKWYLSEMKNTTTGEKITYEYNTINVDCQVGRYASHQETAGQNIEAISLMEGHSYNRARRITKISFPDGHSLEFGYGSPYYRIDVNGDPFVESVTLKYNGTNLKSYNFSYKYFYKKQLLDPATAASDPQYDRQYLRLCLSEVQMKAFSAIIKPYKFEYYIGAESSYPLDRVPSRYSLNVDHWGYYNGTNYIDESAAYNKYSIKNLLKNPNLYRNPGYNAASFGMLKSIQSPAGGLTTYEYEQNEFLSSANINKYTGGVRVKKITVFDGENTTNNQVTEYQYQLSSELSSGWGTEAPVYNGTKVVHVKESLEYTKGGLYMYDHKTAAAIKTITTVMNFVAQVAVSFLPPGISEAVSFVVAVWIQFYVQAIALIFTNVPDQTINYDYFFGLNFSNPAPYMYSRVIITTTSIANGGKTVQEFSRPVDYAAEVQSIAFPYSSKQRFNNWRYGLPINTEIYNSTNDLIKKIENTYLPREAVLSSSNFESCKADVDEYVSSRYDYQGHNYNDYAQDSWIKREFYTPKKGRMFLTGTTETNYTASHTIASANTTIYQYNYSNNQPSSIITTDSKGKFKGQNIYYPTDYNNISTAITTMKQNNIIGIPLTTVLWQQNSGGGQKQLISAKTTEYDVLPDGRIRPVSDYSSIFNAPVLSPLTDNNDPTNLTNYPFYERTGQYVYDAHGDLISVKDDHGRMKTNVYGYNHRRVIAHVSGVPVTEVAYSSFEADDNASIETYDPQGYDQGNNSRMGYNWLKRISRVSPTGIWCYDISGEIHFTMTLSKPYLLTLWSTGTANDIVVGSVHPTRTGPTYNGWTYYEFDLAVNSVNPVLSGPADIYVDEVRLYPTDAKIATSTYDPTFGKTSECDVNNHIIYYEYDLFGRMIAVRDEKRNLIKTYEYHYKN